MSRRRSLSAVALLSALALLAARPGAAPTRFPLTVESIMRGPALVGYPPSGLRWSRDSSELYFEWRRPGEDEASTDAVRRDGVEPRKIGEDERTLVPPAAGGQWDEGRRRVLFVENGDIVLLVAAARSRQRITRTADAESSPRWARRDTAVTFVREGSLFLVPLATGLAEQLVDVRPAKRESRETDSQQYLKAEEEKLIGFTRKANEKRKADEEKRKKQAPPAFETREGQSVVDARTTTTATAGASSTCRRTTPRRTAGAPRSTSRRD